MTTAAEVLSSGQPANAAASVASIPGQPGQAAPGALPNAPAAGWWDTVKDPEVKTWLGNKKYADAETALKGHWSLERLMGADKAGRTVMLPKDDTDAEGWKALSTKLGVPATADGYTLPMPEGADPAFSKTAAGWFHEAGVPPRAANLITEKWNAFIGEQVKAGEAADKAESEKQMTALEQQWGAKFPEQRELAQRGFREFAAQFGLDDKAALDRAESVLGAANLTKFFAGIGALNAESAFAGADGKGQFRTTVADAQAQIDQINTDRIAGKISDFQWRHEFEPKMMKLGQIVAGAKAA